MSGSRKQSIIFGGLISSAGIFVSKILGLVYVIPFNIIAGDANMQYYGYAYTIYAYLLNVSIAGVPFAVATMVAKYYNKGDYKTTLLIKRLAFGLMLCLGFAGMGFMMLASPQLSRIFLSVESTQHDFEITRNVMIIISFALFFVPLLSVYRGFYQGLKDMEIYAFSQVLEQLSRILVLLGAGALAVYVFKMDRIWAIYFAVFSTSVAAICALLHFRMVDRHRMVEMKALAQSQERVPNQNKKALLHELFWIALPYLVTACVGYSNDLVDLGFYSKALEATGVPGQLANYLYGTVIAVHLSKVITIPQILSLGYSASVIPYITSALETKNFKEVKKHILDALESVLYIVIPLSFCLFFFSKEVMMLLFGNPTITFAEAGIQIQQLDYENYLMKWRLIDAILGTICPLLTSIMLASSLRKQGVFSLFIGSIVKLLSIQFSVKFFGMAGSSISNLMYYGVIILLNIYFLTQRFHIRWTYLLRKCLFILLGVIGMAIGYGICFMIFGDITVHGRFGMLPFVALEGVVVCVMYLLVTGFFQVPQTIFHFSTKQLIRKVLK